MTLLLWCRPLENVCVISGSCMMSSRFCSKHDFQRWRFAYFKVKNELNEWNFLYLQWTDFDLLTDRIVASVHVFTFKPEASNIGNKPHTK